MAKYTLMVNILLFFSTVNASLSEENCLIDKNSNSVNFLEKLPTEISVIILEYVGHKDLNSRLAFEQINRSACDLTLYTNKKYYDSDYVHNILDSARHLQHNFYEFINTANRCTISFTERKQISEIIEQIKPTRIIDFRTAFDDFYIVSRTTDIGPNEKISAIKNLIKDQNLNQLRNLLIQKGKGSLIEKHKKYFNQHIFSYKKSYILDIINDNINFKKNLNFLNLVQHGQLLKMGFSYSKNLSYLTIASDAYPKTLEKISTIYKSYKKKILHTYTLEGIEGIITEIRKKVEAVDCIKIDKLETSFTALKRQFHSLLNQKYNNIKNILEEISSQKKNCRIKMTSLLQSRQRKINALEKNLDQDNVSSKNSNRIRKKIEKLDLLNQYKYRISEVFNEEVCMTRHIYNIEKALDFIESVKYKVMSLDVPLNLKKFLFPKLLM